MAEDDVNDLVEWAQQRDVSESTVNAYNQVIKRFWRRRYDTPKGEHPEMADWIKYHPVDGRDTAYGQLHGLSTVNKEENQSSSIECPRCNEVNERGDGFCRPCCYGFHEETREQVEDTLEEAEGGIVEVESETEAKIVKNVLADIRENPVAYIED